MVNIKTRLIIFFAADDREIVYSQQKQDLELTVAAKLRPKLKKVGKIMRSFRHDQNQIPFDYIVDVINWFSQLSLVDRVPEELWTQVCTILQEVVTKTMPKKRKCKKAKCLSEEVLQIAEKRREVKGKGERERYTQLNAEFRRIAKRDKTAFLSDQCKEIEENNRTGRTRELLKKIGDNQGNISCKDELNKGEKWQEPNINGRY